MAISVQPVDGLIHRLLLQNSRSASVPDKRTHQPASQARDQVSISTRARTHHHAGNTTSGHEKALESHLLKLYKMNDASGA